ncbi:Uma2 family endonuclease [Nocardiopsis arvandica]|uniref:Uma2 family endonuclease n=1 Tax=Nocardiopsis sinuspersici TaxID=501010 RepID=A0A7Z0BKU9_9ACTN|nr:Uma2 family endonuclease [Nocardiopsis sinuspersici]NYH55203.1 Uma2 family endonuclease [Nocardiopsis sinuspersici]
MCAQPVPDWLIPPTRGFRAEDLDTLPDLPPHTELIDGSLVLMSPQMGFHSVLLDLVTAGLRSTVPHHYRVRREMTVTLGPRQRPEPDVIVVDTGAVDNRQSTFPPKAVALAVEVVSPESVERDRHRKPQLYAEAGIPHFWRVERNDNAPVVYVYELDPAKACYVPTGIHHERLKVELPYPIDIDLTEVERL